MGTPEFAVPSLNALFEYNYDVPLVVTQPDRPKGRGRIMTQSPVKEVALKFEYNVIQPESMNQRDLIETLSGCEPDLFVVIAYGHILPEKILKIPQRGAINIHASLLPKYRGPAPIHWSIINREETTGVTSIFMDKGMDTGDILLTLQTDIKSDDTTETLHDRLADLGAGLLIKTINGLEENRITPVSQNHNQATYAPMLKKSDGRIDWQRSAVEIEAFIRGMTSWPGAFTFNGENRIKIFKAKALNEKNDKIPGTVVKGFPGELRVATENGVICILEIQNASGKRLSIEDFLKGNPVLPGTIFQ